MDHSRRFRLQAIDKAVVVGVEAAAAEFGIATTVLASWIDQGVIREVVNFSKAHGIKETAEKYGLTTGMVGQWRHKLKKLNRPVPTKNINDLRDETLLKWIEVLKDKGERIRRVDEIADYAINVTVEVLRMRSAEQLKKPLPRRDVPWGPSLDGLIVERRIE